jgi:tetrahydromethanopterin S-methyltransferase subunit H
MYKFQTVQKELCIGGTNFGGQPGKRRAVLVGSLFYPRHTVVTDVQKGTLDTEKLIMRLDAYLNVIESCQCPSALMLYAESGEAARRYLEAVVDRVPGPLFVDSGSSEVRLSFLKHAEDMGILDRVVYNTINAGLSEEESSALRAGPPKNAVVMAFNPRGDDVKGRIYMLESGDGLLDQGLVENAEGLGIKNLLLDVAVTSPQQSAGSALRTIMVAKAKWGLPTGCALHNAVECLDLSGMDDPKEARRHVDSSAVAISMMAGADYVVYGPMEFARRVMPVAAFTDLMLSQSVQDLYTSM